MNIYIPKHLRGITIVNQLCQLIEEYGISGNYIENPESSFDDYQYMLKSDPVKHYLNICIPESDFESEYENQNYEDVINYLSSKFYRVKGTLKVFDYMKEYLGLNFEGEIKYTPRYLEFSLKDLNVSDESLYYEALKNFLNALLYFITLKVNIGIVKQEINSTIESNLGISPVTYLNHTVEFSNKIYPNELIWFDGGGKQLLDNKITYRYQPDLKTIDTIDINGKDLEYKISPRRSLRRSTSLRWLDSSNITFSSITSGTRKLSRINSILLNKDNDLLLNISNPLKLRRSDKLSWSKHRITNVFDLGENKIAIITNIELSCDDLNLKIHPELAIRRSSRLSWNRENVDLVYSKEELFKSRILINPILNLVDSSGNIVTKIEQPAGVSCDYNGKGFMTRLDVLDDDNNSISEINFDLE